MTRRCSHCSNNGHNSRTCPTRGGGGGGGGGGGSSSVGGGVKLFGVRLTDGSIIKKSASMGNLSSLHYHSSSSAAASPNPGSPSSDQPTRLPDGYLSDDPNHASCSTNRRAERKKGVPWTEDEHRLFLLGLQKLGKGDWRGISRNFVTSRTPTQVASHAQKYFIRQSNASRRKRRSSLFDMVPEMDAEQPASAEENFLLPAQEAETDKDQSMHSSSQTVDMDNVNSLSSLDPSLKTDFESMETIPGEPVEEAKEVVAPSRELPPIFPSFFPAYIPVPVPLWPTAAPNVNEDEGQTSQHEILKPIPVLPKQPINVDALVGMSKLSLGETASGHMDVSPLSLKLKGGPARQSAFHASTAVNHQEPGKGTK